MRRLAVILTVGKEVQLYQLESKIQHLPTGSTLPVGDQALYFTSTEESVAASVQQPK
jgi:hypothetical protein